MMTRGRGGVSIPPKSDDVIYEQPLININSTNTTKLLSSKNLTDTFPPIFNFLPLPTPRGSSKSQLLLLVLLECPSQSHPSPSLRRVASTKRTGPHLSNLSLNIRGRESALLLCDNDVFIGWALYIWRRCWCDDEDYDYITMMTIYWTIMMTQGGPGLQTSTTTTTTVLSPEAGLRQVKTNSDIIFHCHS